MFDASQGEIMFREWRRSDAVRVAVQAFYLLRYHAFTITAPTITD
jgi:hypothetical protein